MNQANAAPRKPTWEFAVSKPFEWLCEQLEEATDLDRLEARGTVRLALKSAGLDASRVTGEQMKVVLEKVLPSELDARGLTGTAVLCTRLAAQVPTSEDVAVDSDSPEAVFDRLGSR
jgi:hypothetical protein